MKRTAAVFISIFVFCCAFAQKQDILLRKNFPFTTALENCAGGIVRNDTGLKAVFNEKYRAVEKAATEESGVIRCKLSRKEIEKTGQRLAALAGQTALRDIVSALRESGQYSVYEELPDGEFLKAAWRQDAEGMNRIIDVYALGITPHYAGIDSIDIDIRDENYIRDLRADVRSTVLALSRDGAIYSIAMYAALCWLDVNDRYEAADYEPLEDGLNKKAYEAVKATDWDRYPYSSILVLGCGPERKEETISPQSRMRALYGAELYRQGKAPFLIVSGGRVHPFKTPYSEAFEMKQYLMENCGIPEEAIICEPHARHTTTNIRNSARIMLKQGFPMDKPGLITSSGSQIDYLAKPNFINTCMRHMLVVPFTLGTRLNPREIEYFPLPCATQVVSEDPLDP